MAHPEGTVVREEGGGQHNELNLFKPNNIFCMNGDSTWKSSLLKVGCGVVVGFRCRVNFPQFHLF